MAVSIVVRLHIQTLGELPDYDCHLALLRYYNTVAKANRRSVSHSWEAPYGLADDVVLAENRKLANSLHIGAGWRLPVAVSGDGQEIPGVLYLKRSDGEVFLSTLYLIDKSIQISQGTRLLRSASIRLGSVTKQSREVIAIVEE